jgi:hypothetical protein
MLKTEFNNLIASKLGDIGKIYWTEEEIDRVINEALLNFGAISGYWKNTILVESKTNQQIYDLTKIADVKTDNALISNLTYQTIIDWLDDNLIGYLQLLDLADVVSLITKAINIFQSETKLILAQRQFNIIVGEVIPISDDVLDIVAAYYVDSSGNYYALQRADENSIALIRNDYTINNQRPKFYSLNNLSLLNIDLFPRPAENGFLELIYVVGKAEGQTENSTCLVPDNLVPYLKYKVIADIFDKDNNIDPYRSAYAKQRWAEGLLVGSNYSAIVNTKLNGINKIPASILDFDKFRYDWRNDIATSIKKINNIALAGYNIIGFNRIPDVDIYSALFECITNAPINDVDINLRADYIPIVLDYCVHLASIKDGIANIQKTQAKLQNFIKIAANHSEYLQRRRISYLDLLQKSKYPLRQARVLEEENAA